MTAGLGCDGDTIAITAATQPSIEEIVMGAYPWIPKVHFHNPFLAFENGDEFVKFFRDGAEGKLGPFILVMEGSIPNEKNKAEGYWASFGTDQVTGQPITTCDWIDQAGAKGLGGDRGGHVRDLWRDSRDGRKSDRMHGASGLPGLEVEIGKGGCRSFVCRDARCSRTISWRRCFICCTWRRGERR